VIQAMMEDTKDGDVASWTSFWCLYNGVMAPGAKQHVKSVSIMRSLLKLQLAERKKHKIGK
jgi:hypothetical protein